MDRIGRLRILATLADTLSFTRTATVMGIARSSVTKAINELEAELGTRLLDRTTRSVALTRDGAAFVERAHSALAAFDEAHAMFAGEEARPSGRVRVSVPSRLGRRLVAPALPAFLVRYPDVTVELNVSDRQVDLVREGFDCVLRVGEKPDSELVSRHLGDLRLASVASHGYLAERGAPRTIEELSSHLIVGYASPFTGKVGGWDHLIDGEAVEVPMRHAVVASDAEMYIACAEAGLGMIQVPAFDVRDALAAGTLVEVLPDVPVGSMPIAVLYAHRRNLTPRVAVLVDWMSALVRDAIEVGVDAVNDEGGS